MVYNKSQVIKFKNPDILFDERENKIDVEMNIKYKCSRGSLVNPSFSKHPQIPTFIKLRDQEVNLCTSPSQITETLFT